MAARELHFVPLSKMHSLFQPLFWYLCQHPFWLCTHTAVFFFKVRVMKKVRPVEKHLSLGFGKASQGPWLNWVLREAEESITGGRGNGILPVQRLEEQGMP